MYEILIKQTVTSKKQFEQKYTIDKNYHEVKNHCHNAGKYRGAAHSICNLKYSITKEIAVGFFIRF